MCWYASLPVASLALNVTKARPRGRLCDLAARPALWLHVPCDLTLPRALQQHFAPCIRQREW